MITTSAAQFLCMLVLTLSHQPWESGGDGGGGNDNDVCPKPKKIAMGAKAKVSVKETTTLVRNRRNPRRC